MLVFSSGNSLTWISSFGISSAMTCGFLKMREIALSPLDDPFHQSISVDLH